jgi:hypothetical protein
MRAPAELGLKPGEKKRLLHLGISSAQAGRFPAGLTPALWEVVRADTDAGVQPDIRTTLPTLERIEPGVYDAVWMPHLLQRLFLFDGAQVLTRIFRLLREEGFVLLTLPDGQLAATYLAHARAHEPLFEAAAGAVTAHDLLYGFGKNMEHGHLHLAHRAAYSGEALSLMLREAGFCNITVKCDRFDLHAIGYKYGYDNPKRVERISLVGRSAEEKVAPRAPAVPSTAAVGAQQPAQKRVSDTLDQKPVLWKPLGLGSTAGG